LVNRWRLDSLSNWGWPEVLFSSYSIVPILLSNQNYNTEQGETFMSEKSTHSVSWIVVFIKISEPTWSEKFFPTLRLSTIISILTAWNLSLLLISELNSIWGILITLAKIITYFLVNRYFFGLVVSSSNSTVQNSTLLFLIGKIWVT